MPQLFRREPAFELRHEIRRRARPSPLGGGSRAPLALAAACTLLPGCGRPNEPVEATVPEVPAEPTSIRFVDGTDAAGIAFERDDGRYGDFHYPEAMCGGAIFFDADGDGDADLYLLNGGHLDAAEGGALATNALFVNDGRGRFADATEGSGLGDPRFAAGVAGGDYDNDGDVDLFVTHYGAPHALFRNEGDLVFVDVAREAGVEGIPDFASSCAFADVDGDGWLDLYVANCLDARMDNNIRCEVPTKVDAKPHRRYCTPTRYRPVHDQLFMNRGDGTFADETEERGLAGRAGRSLGVAFADFDADGDPDLVVACDQNPNLLFENLGDGAFRELDHDSGLAVGPDGEARGGMGVAAGDFDGDGRLDALVSYFEGEANGWTTNQGEWRFRDVAVPNGTALSSLNLLGWGTVLFDADLDGDLDACVVNGHLNDDIHLYRTPVAGYEQPNLLYENLGTGRFASRGAEAGPGLALEHNSRGLAAADVDLDGDLDLLVANLRGRPDLLVNQTPRGDNHWLRVRTRGTTSNRDGIGARVELRVGERTLVREVASGQSYQSQSELTVHFGLGPAERVDELHVRWPSGRQTRLTDVAADRTLEVVEPD